MNYVALMYHNVCAPGVLESPDGLFANLSPSITSYFVTRDRFAQHLAAVERTRWLTPLELSTPPVQADLSTDAPRGLITFDDGWAGTAEEAGPILEAHGLTGLVFITTALIGHPLFCSAAQLQRLPRAQFEIGAHTVSHPFLSELPDHDIRRELTDSRRTLEDILGRKVRSVSIPNGAVDERVRKLAIEAGYEFVFTSEVRINRLGDDPSKIGRVAVRRETSPEQVQQWLSGRLGSASWRRRLLELPKRVLGPARYRRLRGGILGQRRGQDEMGSLLNRIQVPISGGEARP